MKLIKNPSYLFVIVLGIVFSSCEDPGADPFANLPEPIEEQFTIFTAEPEIGNTSVVFRGSVVENKKNQSIEYGFMWFRSDDPDPVVAEIEIGSGLFTGNFEIALNDLPKGENLVVCAYLRNSINIENPLIGEERSFRW